MELLKLFWSFFQIGLFSIGGGYAAIGLVEQQAVEINGWLTATEYIDLLTIAEMTPGPITLNAATFVGTRVAGLGGAVLATFACILPSTAIAATLYFIYNKYKDLHVVQGILGGLRPIIVAIIASAGISIIISAFWGEAGFTAGLLSVDVVAVVLFLLAIFVLIRFKLSPAFVIILCGVFGGGAYLLLEHFTSFKII